MGQASTKVPLNTKKGEEILSWQKGTLGTKGQKGRCSSSVAPSASVCETSKRHLKMHQTNCFIMSVLLMIADGT